MRRLILIAIFGIVAIAEPAAAAEQRVALVIGNSAYEDAPLANPVNDARLMAETLRGLGFEVIERTDADQKEMKLAIFELGDRLEAAGKDAVGLFYYAGHGVQVDGQNYLIPLNAQIKRERHVAVEAVGASWVLGQMEFAGNRVNFVILDACRNNPLTRGFRSQLRGLAKMNAPTGSLVAYSTGPGDVAVDGDGANSPYTLALSRVMRTPGLPAEKVFKLVRDAVREETKGEQTPWEESSMTGADFYFNVSVAVTVEAPAASALSDTAAATQQESLFWETVKDSTDSADFEAYLAQYPKGAFSALARLRVKKLKEAQTAAVVPQPTPPSEAVEPAVGVYPKTYQPGVTFKDCDACPEMVVIPAGEFTMGSPSYEEHRNDVEGPQHRVQLPSFALGKYEVTRGQFAAFVRDTGYSAGGDCFVDKGDGDFGKLASKNWRDPNFSQTDRHPVVCVSWDDANEYVKWLGGKTRESYRLPSESEWEYAARAGTTAARYWGNDRNTACTYANIADRSAKQKYPGWTTSNCRDGQVYTAAVGSFKANSFALFDVLGNVQEWTMDCWNDSYSGTPGDGSAWIGGMCDSHGIRGGSWGNGPQFIRSAVRTRGATGARLVFVGFRVARTLVSDATASSSQVQLVAVVPPLRPVVEIEEMDATFVALKTSNVRAEPTTQSDRVGRLTRDAAVAVTGKVRDRNWYRIEHEGETAYIFSTLVKEVDPGELAAWEKIADTSDPADFEAFLGKFSNGYFAERARIRRDELATPPPSSAANPVDLAFWQSVKDSADPKDLNAYLSQFPNGAFAVLARNRLERLKEKRVAIVAPPPSPPAPAPASTSVEPAVGITFGALAINAPSGTLRKIRKSGRIVVGVKADYKPWGFRDSDGKLFGMEIDMAQDVADALGVELELVPVQSSNRMQFLQQGKIDLMIATMTDLPHRRELVGIIEPLYFASGTNVLSRKGAVASWEDLRGKPVCGKQGTFYNKWVSQKYGAKIVAFFGNAEAKQALRDGRCIAWVYDDSSIMADLVSGWYDGYEMPLDTEDVRPWGLAVPLQELNRPFGQFMSDMSYEWHRTGRLIALERKWGIQPTAFLKEMHMQHKTLPPK